MSPIIRYADTPIGAVVKKTDFTPRGECDSRHHGYLPGVTVVYRLGSYRKIPQQFLPLSRGSGEVIKEDHSLTSMGEIVSFFSVLGGECMRTKAVLH